MRRAKGMLLLGLCAFEAGVPWGFCGGKRPVDGIAHRSRLTMHAAAPVSVEDYLKEAEAAGYSMDDESIQQATDTVGSVDFLPAGMEGITLGWVGNFVAITVAIAVVIFFATPLIDTYILGKKEKYDFKTSRIGRILAGEDPMSLPIPEDSLGFFKGTVDELREIRRQNLDPLTWAARPDLRPREESDQEKTDAKPSKESGK